MPTSKRDDDKGKQKKMNQTHKKKKKKNIEIGFHRRLLSRLRFPGIMDQRFGGAPPPGAGKPVAWPEISTKAPSSPSKPASASSSITQLFRRDGNLFTIADALSDKECRALIKAVDDARGFEWQGSAGPSRGEAVRDCGRCARRGPAEEALAARLWKRLGPSILAGLPPSDAARAVGLHSYIRVYAYEPGQKFARHYDDSEVVERNRTATGYTLLIYLSTVGGGGGGGGKGGNGRANGNGNGGGGGGETKFYSDGGKLVASVAPVAGTALLHRHGDRCLMHEGAKVEKSGGTKYVFRSDVVFDVSSCGYWS